MDGEQQSSVDVPGDRDKQSPRVETQGILRLDMSKPRRNSGGSVEFRLPDKDHVQVLPASPQPSVDRLSVSFRDRSDCSDTSVAVNVFDPGSPPAVLHEMVTFNEELPQDAEEEEDDYSMSITQILNRRESTRRGSQRRKKRRPSSPGSQQDSVAAAARRRSSVFTNSSAETVVSMEDGQGQEEIFENIRLHKEVLSSVKLQPWSMRRKIRLVQQAKSYVKKHEGELQERLAQSGSTKDIMARFKMMILKNWQYCRREVTNVASQLVPWELRIKEIESHFGSAVASYFTFLRWMFWVNLVISVVLICFVMLPELLIGDHTKNADRWQMTSEEAATSTFLITMWDFEGALKYSPFFYGYYSDKEKSGARIGYRLPFAYFTAGLAVYVYSFVATLRRMAKNSRMSKLSEKDDECTFTWKLFTGWDYMIGNAETAHNRVASIVLGFKEALLEETEKKKDEKNWRVLGLRLLVNILVFSLLTISAYIVFVVVRRSTEVDPNASWWRNNEITISLSIISLIFPIFFEVLGMFEGYHPRKSLRIQLARIMVLNLLNLYTLIFSLFWKISHMVVELEALNPRMNLSTTVMPSTSSTKCLHCSAAVATIGVLLTTTGIPSIPVTPTMASTDYVLNITDTSLFPSGHSFVSSTEYDTSSTSYDTTSTSNDPSLPTFDYDDKSDGFTAENRGIEPVTDTAPFALAQVLPPSEQTGQSSKMCRDGTRCDVLNQDVADKEKLKKLSNLCWETMFGQEMVKLTIMDLVLTVISTFLVDFIRALLVRFLNHCWCWDLEKKFPQYGDFKIAENILHLVNNQGMVWMGMFFSPGLPFINLVKLMIMMYLRSWAVLTCNVPHEVVFRASRSNNFYLALLLTMLFLCVLPVGFAIVWIKPSWHCGPFATYHRTYHIITDYLRWALPSILQQALDYIASPAIVIPLLMLLVLIIYYLVSLTNSLREANSDLKVQLRRERTEERRKMFRLVDKKNRKGSGESDVFAKWKNILPDVPSVAQDCVDDSEAAAHRSGAKKELLSRLLRRTLSSVTSDEENAFVEDAAYVQKNTANKGADRDVMATTVHEKVLDSRLAPRSSLKSEIPLIKISKTESDECILTDKEKSPLLRFKEAVMKTIRAYRAHNKQAGGTEHHNMQRFVEKNLVSGGRDSSNDACCPLAKEEKLPLDLQ